MSVNIGYQIEEDFSYSEKRQADAKIIFGTFNDQVSKLKALISEEEIYSVKQEPIKDIPQ